MTLISDGLGFWPEGVGFENLSDGQVSLGLRWSGTFLSFVHGPIS